MHTNIIKTQRNLSSVLALLLTITSTYGSEYEDSVVSTNTKTLCRDWASLTLGSYEINNNVWGKGNMHGYSQCIFSRINVSKDTPDSYGWYWNWPVTGDGVKAYPSVLYGRKPWNAYSTTSKLPVAIKKLKQLNVSYKVKEEHSGAVNLLLEAWITNNINSKPNDRVGELAIQLYQKNWPGQAGKFVASIKIDNIPYDFYIDKAITVPGDAITWVYYGFVYTGEPILSQKVNMMHFINYLVKHDYLSNKHFVASVELGNEIDHGKGKTVVEQFSVQLTQ